MLKWVCVAGSLIVLGLALVFGWQSFADRIGQVDVTVAITDWPTSELALAAEAEDFFYKYELRGRGNNYGHDLDGALLAFRDGRVDVALVPLADGVALRLAGSPLRIVASVDYSVGATALVADENVRTLADISGRRISISRTQADRLFLDDALTKGGVDPAPVTVVRQSAVDSIRAFLVGSVDAVIVNEPFLRLATSRRRSHNLFSSRDAPISMPTVIIVRDGYLANHSSNVAKFLSGWFDLIDFMQQAESQRREVFSTVAIASGLALATVEGEFAGIMLENFADNAVAFTRSGDRSSLYESVDRVLSYLDQPQQFDHSLEAQYVIEPTFIRRGLRGGL